MMTLTSLFYGTGRLLANRWKKTEAMKIAAQQAYDSAISSLPGVVKIFVCSSVIML